MGLAAVFVFLVGGFFTIRFRFFYLLHPIKTVRAMPFENGLSQMLLSLGGTVGVGNIAGVAVALGIGGAGAVFWMWVGAFFSMALKYAEIMLGMLKRTADGGGAAYYIKERLGGFAAAVFSVLLVCNCVMMGGVVQSSAISEAFFGAFSLSPMVTGVLVSIITAAVFFLGINLFSLSAYVVPAMSVGYVLAAFAVIAADFSSIPNVIERIFADAFEPLAAGGGILGVLLSPALGQGIAKGLFSNEAGCGTAPSAHIASGEKEPARQALFGIFEVFVDTVLMCTLTAFVILLTIGDAFGNGGMSATAIAFSSFFGSAAPAVLAIFVALFAFCTIIAFGYYGKEALSFFKASKSVKDAFVIFYCISLFFGAVIAPRVVWEICDCIVCIMLIINTTAVFLSNGELAKEHNRFYVHIGKYASSASKMRSRSAAGTKNAIPISDSET